MVYPEHAGCMHAVRLLVVIFTALLLLPITGPAAAADLNTNRPGMDYTSFDLPSPDYNLCDAACAQDAACRAWTYVSPGIQGPDARCWLKNDVPSPVADICCVSGIRMETVSGIRTRATRSASALTSPTTVPTLAEIRTNVVVMTTTPVPVSTMELAGTRNAGTRMTMPVTTTLPPTTAIQTPAIPPKTATVGAPVTQLFQELQKTVTPVPTFTAIEPDTAPSFLYGIPAAIGNFAAIIIGGKPILPGGQGSASTGIPVPSLGMKATMDTDLAGTDYRSPLLPDTEPVPPACEDMCASDPNCLGWSYVRPGVQNEKAVCWMKSRVTGIGGSPGIVSGMKAVTAETQLIIANDSSLPPEARLPENQTRIAAVMRDNMDRFDSSWRQDLHSRLAPVNDQIAAAGVKSAQQQSAAARQRLLLVQSQNHIKPVPLTLYSSAFGSGTGGPGGISYQSISGLLASDIWIPDKPSALPGNTGRTLSTAPPRIDSIEPLISFAGEVPKTTKNGVVDGQYVMIHGAFGSCPTGNCRVRLIYRLEQGTSFEFQPGGGPAYVTDLIPYRNDWSRSWNERFIVAKIPEIIIPQGPDINLTGQTLAFNATIIVINDDDFKGKPLTYPVNLVKGGPGIGWYESTPRLLSNEDWIHSGGELWIYGKGFGSPGNGAEVTIDLSGSSQPQLSKMGTQYLTTDTWTDTAIHGWVTKIPGNYSPGTAVLTVKNSQYQLADHKTVRYGPIMKLTQNSGLHYFFLDKKEDGDSAEQADNVLVVRHNTGTCGWSFFHIFYKGHDGTDSFFDKKPLPPGVLVLRTSIVQVKPDDTSQALRYLASELGEMASDITSGNFAGWMMHLATKLFGWLFGSGYGSYGADITNAGTFFSPRYEIHWYNTCQEEYAGVQEEYMATFTLYGPEDEITRISQYTS